MSGLDMSNFNSIYVFKNYNQSYARSQLAYLPVIYPYKSIYDFK